MSTSIKGGCFYNLHCSRTFVCPWDLQDDILCSLRLCTAAPAVELVTVTGCDVDADSSSTAIVSSSLTFVRIKIRSALVAEAVRVTTFPFKFMAAEIVPEHDTLRNARPKTTHIVGTVPR